jgi:hypothetical protein
MELRNVPEPQRSSPVHAFEGPILPNGSGDAELFPDNRNRAFPEDFYGVQHFFVWQRRDTHLECDARNATKNFVHVKDLFRDRFCVAD